MEKRTTHGDCVEVLERVQLLASKLAPSFLLRSSARSSHFLAKTVLNGRVASQHPESPGQRSRGRFVAAEGRGGLARSATGQREDLRKNESLRSGNMSL